MNKKKEHVDPRMAKALCRYEVVSRYLAMKPRRGLRKKLLEKLAKETWTGPNGEPFAVEAETIRAWVRRYRRGGLEGLMDKERSRRGVEALDEAQKELVCRLKQDVPARSLERIIKIAEATEQIEEGVLRRSTVHRVLQSRGLSERYCRTPDLKDLDRFEADAPNDLWQSDMLVGPWLPDPDRPGKVRRAVLFAFIDDHSRMLLHGRWSFPQDLPQMELVFRRAVQKHGVPHRAYFDNGKVYRANHIKQMVAMLDIYRLVFTKPLRPEGHGLCADEHKPCYAQLRIMCTYYMQRQSCMRFERYGVHIIRACRGRRASACWAEIEFRPFSAPVVVARRLLSLRGPPPNIDVLWRYLRVPAAKLSQ